MEPLNNRFGGGAAESQISPQVAVIMLIAIVLILTLPRAKAIMPFLLGYFTIPMGEVVILGGLHFTVLRILILTVLARMLTSRKSSGAKFLGGFNAVDQVAVLWAVSAVIIFSLQWMETQALINSLGDLIGTLGGYLAVRFLVPDRDAVWRTIKVLAVICAIQGVCMINEKITQFNVFGLLGGIPTDVTYRDGHVRAAGVMGCLYAGVFGGVLIPIFIWLWTNGKSRLVAFAGLFGAMAMVVASYSSTSYMALGGGILGLCMWPLRKWMRLARWGLVSVLVGLHMVMKAPVWALIARIDLTGSSSGDQRFELLDNCIRHFGDWWLLGTRDYNTWGWGMWDLVNQFVAVALTGGLLTLILYIAIYKRSFRAIGIARKQVEGDRAEVWLLWCLGSTLFGTVVASFGINYVPQLLMGMFPVLACISVVTFGATQAAVQTDEGLSPAHLASSRGAVRAYVPLGAATQKARPEFSPGSKDRSIPWLKA